MNLLEIKEFSVFLFSKKKIIFFSCIFLFILTFLFHYLLPQNYRGEILIKKFNDESVTEFANQENKFFGLLNYLNSKYNLSYNLKHFKDKDHSKYTFNELEQRYLFNEDYFFDFIRKNIDSKLIKEGIFYSKIFEKKSESEINQKVLEYIKKIKLNSSKEFLTAFIRSKENYLYLTFKYKDPDKIKIFLDYLISQSIENLNKEYFVNRKLEFIKKIEDNLKKQKALNKLAIESAPKYSVIDKGYSDLKFNQKITKKKYIIKAKECSVRIENLIKRIDFAKNKSNLDAKIKIYDFILDINNSKYFLESLLVESKKITNCGIKIEPFQGYYDLMQETIILFENDQLEILKTPYNINNKNDMYDLNLVNYKKSNINIIKIEKFIFEKSFAVLFFSIFTFIFYYLINFLKKK